MQDVRWAPLPRIERRHRRPCFEVELGKENRASVAEKQTRVSIMRSSDEDSDFV